MVNLLTILIIIAAATAIYSSYKYQKLHYLSKPLATTLILILALLNGGFSFVQYTLLIAFGLIFSLSGDIFLMLDEKHFIKGLLSFLLAHIIYIWAFSLDTGLSATLPITVTVIIVALFSMRLIGSRAGKMKLPVYVYILVISVMLWRGWEFYQFAGNESSWYAAIGATLFIISDFILGYNKFRGKIPHDRLWTLLTYYLAQYFIASSI